MSLEEDNLGGNRSDASSMRVHNSSSPSGDTHGQFNSFIDLLHQLNQLSNSRYAMLSRGKLDAETSRDVTLRQIQVLGALNEGAPFSQTQLCVATGMDPSTMSVVLRRLSNSGLISRRRSSEDNRVVKVSMTRRGKRVSMLGTAMISELERDMLAPLSEQTRSELLNGLNEIVMSARCASKSG